MQKDSCTANLARLNRTTMCDMQRMHASMYVCMYDDDQGCIRATVRDKLSAVHSILCEDPSPRDTRVLPCVLRDVPSSVLKGRTAAVGAASRLCGYVVCGDLTCTTTPSIASDRAVPPPKFVSLRSPTAVHLRTATTLRPVFLPRTSEVK